MKYLARAAPDAAVSAVAAEIRREFGAAVPPFMLHAASPDLLAAVWILCRETLLVGVVPRARKEAVATTVSRINQCPYCVDAHVTMLHALDAHSLAGELSDAIGHDATRDPLVRWAAATRSPGSPLLASPPFTDAEAPEIVGTAVCFHYVNRMVSVLLGESPLPDVPLVSKGWAARLAGIYFGFAARRDKRPGATFRHLGHLEVVRGADPWAAGSANVERACALFQRVIDAIEARLVAPALRDVVIHELATWRGEDAPLGRAWLERASEKLAPELRAPARLALSTAIAPHRVSEDLVDEFRKSESSDRVLVEFLAWSSWQAARRIGEWIRPR